MMTIYDAASSALVAREGVAPIGDATKWIDLFDPTPEEDRFVEQALGVSVPTRAEMREIEASNRLYHENGACYMTGVIVHKIDASLPEYSPVTFIVAGRRLVTVRYADFKAIPMFLSRVEKGDAPAGNGAEIVAGLLESFINRVADLIERIQDDTNTHATAIFATRKTKAMSLDALLTSVGTDQDITSRAQESLSTIDRLLHYLAGSVRDRDGDAKTLQRIESIQSDVRALSENLKFLSTRTSFLLNATLGQITNEQNQIIKLFSVVAVLLLPPTLVASIWGMNFEWLPWTREPWGFWAALGAMALSAIVPYIYFKRRGWL